MKETFNTKEGKDWLLSVLRNEIVKVTFEKKDGTLRDLYCTLKESKIPEENKPKGTGKERSDEVCAVFDLENNGWRSFKYNSVKEIRFNLGENDFLKENFNYE